MINEFQNTVLEEELDGFYTVNRINNPMRKFGLVHRDLGKVGAVEPDRVIQLVSRMVRYNLPFKKPLVIGLSESSILLGRVVCEFFGGGKLLFSTRYPHDKTQMVPFSEVHSHAPSQYLNLSQAHHFTEVCIIEDEITTGNTIMNLVRVLAENLTSISSICVLALKMFCSDQRVADMQIQAKKIGISLSIGSIFRGNHCEESNMRFSVKKNNVSDNREIPCARYSLIELARGRIDLFDSKASILRYKRWGKLLSDLDLSYTVTVIGVSEAIDLAFEISQVLIHQGHKAFFRHLTISPWEVPGWTFSPSIPGTKPLHLYIPPHNGGVYIIVYDQPFQVNQVNKLVNCLKNIGSKTYIFNGENYAKISEK